ncbi:MAG: tRNA (adenosine(37)-N6)-threonylcarbamoyltransferase complex transferase subunit TsaD [Candidatus Dependentiae bacterium]
MKQPTILAIESSCDETAAAVYNEQDGMLSNVLFSQIDLHKQYGGVVPEIASRSHVQKIKPIVQEALQKANKTLDDIDIIAVTSKPGLPGSLLIGVSFAKALAYAKKIPIIGVNHLEGHAFSSMIEHNVPFPHICLTASGGHSSMYLIKDFGEYEIIGQTIDDAAGEAFDKIAKLINLGYPGGPIVENLAREANFKDFYSYPRGKQNMINFSFSGLKTAVLYDLVKRDAFDLKTKTFLKNNDKQLKKEVASSLLVCMGDIFKNKLKLALQLYPKVKAVTFVGGVACNKYLKQQLSEFCEKRGLTFFSPSPQYCTDNAAMIAFVANYKAKQNKFDDLSLDIF